jgi:DNA invertase Pin-like site-specific DNA recombinase
MSASRVRAAQYVRMSTEHQTYSIEFQTAANTAYALEHGYDLVHTFVDAGISGVSVRGRDGLKTLLATVVGGSADFATILVYDVSRWGRFQDPDQAAHYEFICRDAGVSVEYCAEAFANDGAMASTLAKSLKRIMAAEYSRELSDKVSRAKRGLAAKGYWQGGPPALGLRRIALGTRRRLVMEAGERNALQGARVGLVLGPPEEIELVRRFFRDFLAGLSPRLIADQLNAEEIPAPRGGLWRPETIYAILRNEIYAGVMVAGRHHYRLGRRTATSPDQWKRVPDVVPAVVSPSMFAVVQQQFQQRKRPSSDAEMLDELRCVLADRRRLSFKIIQQDRRTHYPSSYVRRFGSLEAAYQLVGYELSNKQKLAIANIRKHRPDLRRTWAKPEPIAAKGARIE